MLLVLSAANWAYTWIRPDARHGRARRSLLRDADRRGQGVRDRGRRRLRRGPLLIVNPHASKVSDERRRPRAARRSPPGREVLAHGRPGRGDGDRARARGVGRRDLRPLGRRDVQRGAERRQRPRAARVPPGRGHERAAARARARARPRRRGARSPRAASRGRSGSAASTAAASRFNAGHRLRRRARPADRRARPGRRRDAGRATSLRARRGRARSRRAAGGSPTALEIEGVGRAAFVARRELRPPTRTPGGSARPRRARRVVRPAGSTSSRRRPCARRRLPRLARRRSSRGARPAARVSRVLHDVDRIVVRCDVPLPLQVDGEDLGDVEHAVFESEPRAVTALVPG